MTKLHRWVADSGYIYYKYGSHGGDHRKHRDRPCGNPPAVPTGVVLSFQATEALTHLVFTGKVKWNEVTADTAGHKTKIDSYEVQMRATDVNGVPVETQDDTDGDAVNDTRIRIARKNPVQSVGITVATAAASVATFTTRRDHGFAINDRITVSGMTPGAYNGNWTVASVPTTTTLTANIGSTPADGTDFGKLSDRDDKLHVITRKLPRPKTWYWQARVRAVDADQCQGNWSVWTTPGLPWTGADPQPPTPTGLNITFDNKDRNRHNRWRAIVEWDEVLNWDVPGGDREDDMSAYSVQMEKSNDGASADGTKRWARRVEAKSEDADTTQHLIRHVIFRRYYYRARVRSIDRFNRRGVWSAWTAWQQPGSEGPPQPTNVKIFDNATNRVVTKWDAPTDPNDSEIIDVDIDHFQVQVSTSSTFATIYDFDRYHSSMKRAFKIAAADEGGTFYARVRSLNSEADKSAWIPATLAGNSSPSATASGVTIGAGGGGSGKTKHKWFFHGKLTEVDEVDSDDLDIDEAITLKKVRLRVKNASTGNDIKVKAFNNNTNLVATFTIPAGDKRVAYDSLSYAFADGDSLSCAITQVGVASDPGKNLTVLMVFDAP